MVDDHTTFDVDSYAADLVVGHVAETERREVARSRPSGTRTAFNVYCVYAVVSLAVVALLGESPAGPLATLVLGATGPICAVIGVWLHKPLVPSAWLMIGGVIVLSALSRGAQTAFPVLGSSLWYLTISLTPYMLAMWGIARLLRARRGPEQPGAFVDGVLVTLTATLVIWEFLAVPAAMLHNGGLSYALLNAAFPIASTVILYRVTQLALTRVVDVPTFRLFVAALSVVLIGDLVYAMDDAGHINVGFEVVNNLYVMMSVFLSLAALHPSMVKLTEPAEILPSRLNRSRIMVLTVSMATPIIVIAAKPPTLALERVPLTLFGISIVALVMWRVLDAIRQYARSEGRLAHAATHDSLTGLPNRALLLTEIERLMGRRDRGGVAVFFCDLDRFKHVNDTWGHSVGDELLISVAERLVEGSRIFDGTVARIGGDEFVVLCRGVRDEAAARSLAQQSLAAFSRPFRLSVGEFHMAPSVGVAWCPPDAVQSATDLIRHADTAMYAAKHDDSHVAVFDDSMQDDAALRLQLENELHGAIEREELVVHYQPVVEVDSGAISSFEALVRWQHPTRGLLGPGEFIPVAEETGAIIEIGNYVLADTIATLGHWYSLHGAACPGVAVNVSGRQLRDPRFADRVEALLADHGVPADRLCVEITETVILDASEVTGEQLERLSALGVSVAADDFGTGYSSLSYLKQFPVNRVKIDRGFVAGLDTPEGKRTDDEAIVDAVLAMAAALGINVVAEGVETDAQRAHLSARGCQWAQGWLFSKAVPAVEAGSMLGRTLPLPAPLGA